MTSIHKSDAQRRPPWDEPGVAEAVDQYWKEAGFERAHRLSVAKIVEKLKPDSLLDVGCGTGSLYSLISSIVREYCGVDFSIEMLRMAKLAHDHMDVVRADCNNLPFREAVFDLATCVDVLQHMDEVDSCISELRRVSCRHGLIVTWAHNLPTQRTKINLQIHEGRLKRQLVDDSNGNFLNITYNLNELLAKILGSADVSPADLTVYVLGVNNFAVQFDVSITSQDRSSATGPSIVVDDTLVLGELALAAQLRSALQKTEKALQKTEEALQIKEEEAQQAQAHLGLVREKATAMAEQLELLRRRKMNRWLDRIFDRSDARDRISPSYHQMREDSLNFYKGLKGFRLRASLDLRTVRFVTYPLDLTRPGLAGILLAPVIDVDLSKGLFGIEIVSSGGEIVAQATISVRQIDEAAPTSFTFTPIQCSGRERMRLRVLARDVDGPIRILEWQRYSALRLGALQTRAFCGFLYSSMS